MLALVRITELIPDVIVDMRYAGPLNIIGKPISHERSPRLAPAVARALQRAADLLRTQGYRVVIWDAYRTANTQEQLRSWHTDARYVLEKSNHENGTAVDLTLATLQGVLVDMGTDHDEFTEQAHADAHNLSIEQTKHRNILATAMEADGNFRQWPYEWWHFDYITRAE